MEGLFYSGDLGKDVKHEPRLVPWWTMLAFAKSPGTKPGDLAGH